MAGIMNGVGIKWGAANQHDFHPHKTCSLVGQESVK